MTIEKI